MEEDDFKYEVSYKHDYNSPFFTTYEDGPGARLPLRSPDSKIPFVEVFVGRLPKDLNKGGIRRLFKRHKIDILDCKLIENDDGTASNAAIVQVKNIWTATRAIQSLNNTPPFNLKVTLAEEKEDYEKKKKLLEEENIRRARIAIGLEEEVVKPTVAEDKQLESGN